jgi:hypothetical protein
MVINDVNSVLYVYNLKSFFVFLPKGIQTPKCLAIMNRINTYVNVLVIIVSYCLIFMGNLINFECSTIFVQPSAT